MHSRTNTPITILIAVVAILAIGQIYTLSRLSREGAQIAARPANTQATATQPPSLIPPSTMIAPISGIVVSTNSSAIVIGNASSTRVLSIDSSTVIVRLGGFKDSQQQAADMEAFRISSNELAKDPEKNKLALQTLVAPSPYKETKIAVSDIKAGEEIIGYTFIKDGSLYVARVNVVPITSNSSEPKTTL